jgi:hypothetical protein
MVVHKAIVKIQITTTAIILNFKVKQGTSPTITIVIYEKRPVSNSIKVALTFS